MLNKRITKIVILNTGLKYINSKIKIKKKIAKFQTALFWSYMRGYKHRCVPVWG